MEKRKKLKLFFIFIYFIFAGIIVSYFKLSYLPSVLIYFGIPSIYITLRKKEIFRKTTLYSLLLVIPCVFIIDYIAIASNAWYEVSTLKIFLLNILPLDSLIWGFLFGYFVISFYEYFLDRDKNKKKFSKKIKYLIYIIAIISVIFGLIYSLNRELLSVRYFYFILIFTMFSIPAIGIIRNYPNLFKKVIYLGAYFTILLFIYELSAIYTGQWFFNGEYLGMVTLFKISFPYEEFLFMLIAPSAFIWVYEFFADDRK